MNITNEAEIHLIFIRAESLENYYYHIHLSAQFYFYENTWMLSWFSLGKLFFRIHDVQHFDLSGVVSVYCLYPQSPCLSSPTSSPAPARINKEGEWTRRDQRTTSYAEQFLREVEMLHSGSSSGRHGRVNWHFYNDCPAAAAAGQRWCGCGGGAVQISNIWPKCQRRAELQLEWWRCLHSALERETKVCQVFTIT